MAARHLKGVHATIIDSSTINDIIGGSQRGSDGLQSILDNIALAIYKEPLLQAAKASSDKYLATPWTLCQPADGKGETLYLGIDVGHSEGAKSQSCNMHSHIQRLQLNAGR